MVPSDLHEWHTPAPTCYVCLAHLGPQLSPIGHKVWPLSGQQMSPWPLHPALKKPLVLDDQLAWLIIKQSHGIRLVTLVPPGKLPKSTLSLPDMVAPQLLEPCCNAADFGKVGFFLIWVWLIKQRGQSWDDQAW